MAIWLLFIFDVNASPLKEAVQMSQTSETPPVLPRNQFVHITPITNQTLSPDGRLLSYIHTHATFSELWEFNIAKQQHRLLLTAKDIEQALWSADSQFLFIQNNSGLSGISLEPNAYARLITEIDESKDQYFYGVDSTHNQAVILSEKDYKTSQHKLLRVTVDGKNETLYSGHKRVLDYLLNAAGQLVFMKQQGDQGTDLYDVRSKTPKLISHCDWFDACALQAYDPVKNRLLVKARFKQDLTSLFAINLKDNSTDILHQDPNQQFDLTKVYYDQGATPRLSLYQDQFVSQYSLDTATQQQLDRLKQQLIAVTQPHSVWVLKPSENFAVWLALDIGSNRPQPQAYLFDQTSQTLSQPMAEVYQSVTAKSAALKTIHLAPKIAINYTATDGMQLFGYLTLPLGRHISQVPLVVKPHGGPWSRVTGNYDPITQYLANRGFAVFEPNFRASIGMGKHYVLSANQDFGDGRVQQDIIDGLHYVLSQGVGHSDKLAIYGHSFGGFSTLAGLAFTPELFKVGIAGAPPTDIAESVKLLMQQNQTDSDLVGQFKIQQLALDPNNNDAMLRFYQNSPDAHWQKIKQPLYIMAGGRDPKVSIARVKDFSTRLAQANKPISLLVDDLEGHSPKRDIAHEAYLYLLEKALATHLKSDYQQQLSPMLAAYLKRHLVIDNNAITPE